MIRIKGFTCHNTGEGKRISYVFSEIDSDGNTVRENVNSTFVIVNEELSSAADIIYKFLLDRESAKV
ncbi:MAG: hypothetical protein E6860_07490 [Clostridium sp.]|uniref:hypothetical protein n=1 Tax=Clostridium sp. TaxID=1506 RepID=UPI0029034300|nr:hypothetical protein [Clostridium sp.]MDU1585378.1 hypothetical protein [Clostridium sp.]MDU1978480.1 hypothetical protein [Clostridium sp.]MDU1994722.1 hypothetical protein [Clostridium sp.]MDU6048381.1 hypothetical protein [Clostridium sp.]MDU6222439.1 hypothetical protein [Clostridium sp.]